MRYQTIQLDPERELTTLTTYILGPEVAFKGPRPAVIVCPGGAYFDCADCEGEPVALTINSWGYQAFVLRYSTYFYEHDYD